MNRSEIAVLRTKLRALNIEYSALVRGRTGQDTCVRMEALRAERRALMALIASQRVRGLNHHIAPSTAALSLPGSAIEAAPTAGAPAVGAASAVEVPRASASGWDMLPLLAG